LVGPVASVEAVMNAGAPAVKSNELSDPDTPPLASHVQPLEVTGALGALHFQPVVASCTFTSSSTADVVAQIALIVVVDETEIGPVYLVEAVLAGYPLVVYQIVVPVEGLQVIETVFVPVYVPAAGENVI
jgi:hypothetical protein